VQLHGELCKKLYTVVHEVSNAIPALEATRPGSNSGLLALSSLRIAVDKAKNLLQYCSECSKLYLVCNLSIFICVNMLAVSMYTWTFLGTTLLQYHIVDGSWIILVIKLAGCV
jgi:hypothetical protein